jgi:TolB protein
MRDTRLVYVAATFALLFAAAPTIAEGGFDNTRIVFSAYHLGDWDLYTVRPDGSDLRQLTRGADREMHPDWSPDGRQIAYTVSPSDDLRIRRIYVMNADGTNPSRLTTTEDGLAQWPAWSPDGSQIAFSSSVGVEVMSRSGADRRLLVAPGSQPSWSPDGTSIAYQHWRIGPGFNIYFDVFVTDVAGKNVRQLPTIGVSTAAPAWSPTEDRIIVSSSGEPWTINSAGRDANRILTNQGAVYFTAWSSDGRHLLYEDGHSLYTMRADGSGARLLTDSLPWGVASGASWSPPLRAPEADRPSIRIVSPTPRQSFPSHTTAIRLAVSTVNHSGPWIWRLDSPLSVDTVTTEERVSPDNEATIHGLSPGTTHTAHVACVDDGGRVLATPPPTSVTFEVAPPTHPYDDTAFALLHGSKSQHPALHVMSGAGRRRIEVHRGVDRLPPSWSPDGDTLLYSAGSRMWTVERGSWTPRPLSATPEDGAGDWSPDGSQIVFGSHRGPAGWELYVMDSGGGEARRLTYGSDNDRWAQSRYPVWSPDGSQIAFTRHRFSVDSVRVMNADGSGERTLGSGWLPEWSPDGSRIAYTDTVEGRPAIHVMAADGSNARALAPTWIHRWSRLSWSPDGASIAFTRVDGPPDNQQGLYTIGVDDGAEVLVAEGNHMAHPTWSPIVAPSDVRRVPVYLATGLSLFGAPVDTAELHFAGQSLLLQRRGDRLAASHLAALGASLCVRIEDGVMRPMIARDGAIVVGEDFVIPPGQAVIVNMPTGLAFTLEGLPPAAPRQTAVPRSVWAFAVGGSLPLPQGTGADLAMTYSHVRVVNTSTGRSVHGNLRADGTFSALLWNSDKGAAVSLGDNVRVELVLHGGEAWPIMDRVITPDDLRVASVVYNSPADRRPGMALLPPFPSPANPEVWTPFVLDEASEVMLRFYDSRGRVVRRLDLGYLDPGYYVRKGSAGRWDGKNDLGERVAGGVYIVELNANGQRRFGRVVVAR